MMRGMFAVFAVFAALTLPARADNCLTTSSLATTTQTVAATNGGSFFLVEGNEVATTNPAGFTSIPLGAGGNNPGGSLGCGLGSSATGKDALAIGSNAKASGDRSTALGNNAVASAKDAVALGNGSIANRDNTVSVGNAGNARQITNVAVGTQPTDAVNVSQLLQTANAFQQTTQNLQNQITENKKIANAGISMAMAAAGMAMSGGNGGKEGKVALGGGFGEFAGTVSFSAGLSYAPVKSLNFSAGVSVAPLVTPVQVGVFGGGSWILN